MVQSVDGSLSVELGVHTTGNTGRKELVAGVEIGQLTTAPLLPLPPLTPLTPLTLPPLPPLTPPTRTAMLGLGKNLGVCNVAIQASNFGLCAGDSVQKKTVLVVKRSHTTALVPPGALEGWTIQRIGSTTASASLVPPGLLGPTGLLGLTRLLGPTG